MAIGAGFTMSVTITNAISSCPTDSRGQASGLLLTGRQLGTLMGLAMAGNLISHVQDYLVTNSLTTLPSAISAGVEKLWQQQHDLYSIGQAYPQLMTSMQDNIAKSISVGYWLAALTAFVACLAAILLLPKAKPGSQTN
jgi:predicted MFS family arabinose efflux permease